jgi:hypothetical protein
MKALWRRTARRAPCPQAWEIEAARDGRLSGDAVDDVARHVERCAECRALSRYVSGLGRALRDLDEPKIIDAGVLGLRQRILGRIDAEMSGRSIPPAAPESGALPTVRRRRVLISLVAATACVVGAALWKRPVPPPATAASSMTTTVETTDEGGARWTRTTNRGVEWIDLADGTLRLHVTHAPGSRRVLVRVPDGEIEDVGTIFHVVVRKGRTERVGVDEGRVTIRLANTAPITLSSGATWERPEESVAVLPALSAVATATTKRPQAVPTTRSSGLVDPAPDATGEDAAYLHTISLLREGRNAEARLAARQYLRQFPGGFRREEMARIAEP